MLQQNESLNQHVNKISQEGGLQAAQLYYPIILEVGISGTDFRLT